MNYDVIVIGSGIGGMVAASILARLNKKKVLVLEKHYEIGGLTHEFRRGPYAWDVGVHYLGSSIKESLGSKIFNFVTEGRIKWHEMPGVYEKFVYPDFTVEVSKEKDKHQDDLIRLFPAEEKAIRKYFKDVWRGRGWYVREIFAGIAPPILRGLLKFINLFSKKLALSTVDEYLKKNVKDPKLRAVLPSRWGDQGLTPEHSAFCIQSIIDTHYMKGGFFPDKGAEKLTLHMETTIERYGGAVLANKEVTEIILKNGAAVGVKYKDLSRAKPEVHEIYAPTIISNTGAWSTYLNLLPQSLDLPIQHKLKNHFHGFSSATLFLGLKDSPETIGQNGANLWLYDTYDHSDIPDAANNLLEGSPKLCFVSFPSLKNNKKGAHTAEIVTLLPYSLFEKWKDEPWKERSPEYYQLKDQISESLLTYVDKRVPGFRNLVCYKELATPLTIEHFTGKIYGSLYNLPPTPDRYRMKELGARTPIKNLYLSGADASALGVMGATLGGFSAASVANGAFGVFKVIVAMSRALRLGNPDMPDSPTKTVSENKVLGKVIEKNQVKNDIYQLIFDVKTDIPFLPGDHVKLKIADNEWRPYTITNINDSRVSFLIDTKHEGEGSMFIRDLNAGDDIMVRLTMNDFRLKDPERDIIVFTSGVGIAPFLSILQTLEHKNYKKKIRLYFGSLDEEGIFVKDLLQPYVNSLGLEVTYCVDRTAEGSEYFNGTVIEAFNRDNINAADHDFYACGHPHMVRAVLAYLREKGATNIYW